MAIKFRVERWTMQHSPNPAVLRLHLERDGYRVNHWADQPGCVYGMRKHKEDKSHWVVSGELEITIEMGATYRLAAGDRDFLPAHTNHTSRVVSEEPAQYFVGEKLVFAQGSATSVQTEVEELLPPGVREFLGLDRLERLAAQREEAEALEAAAVENIDSGEPVVEEVHEVEPTTDGTVTDAEAEVSADEADGK